MFSSLWKLWLTNFPKTSKPYLAMMNGTGQSLTASDKAQDGDCEDLWSLLKEPILPASNRAQYPVAHCCCVLGPCV